MQKDLTLNVDYGDCGQQIGACLTLLWYYLISKILT